MCPLNAICLEIILRIHRSVLKIIATRQTTFQGHRDTKSSVIASRKTKTPVIGAEQQSGAYQQSYHSYQHPI